MLEEGDLVQARDEFTGDVTAKSISHKFINWYDGDVRELTLYTDSGEEIILMIKLFMKLRIWPDPNLEWPLSDSRGYIIAPNKIGVVEVKVVVDTKKDRIVTGYPTNTPKNPK